MRMAGICCWLEAAAAVPMGAQVITGETARLSHSAVSSIGLRTARLVYSPAYESVGITQNRWRSRLTGRTAIAYQSDPIS